LTLKECEYRDHVDMQAKLQRKQDTIVQLKKLLSRSDDLLEAQYAMWDTSRWDTANSHGSGIGSKSSSSLEGTASSSWGWPDRQIAGSLAPSLSTAFVFVRIRGNRDVYSGKVKSEGVLRSRQLSAS